MDATKLNLMSLAELTKLAKTFPDRSKEREKILAVILKRENQHWKLNEWAANCSVQVPRRVFGSNGLFTTDSYAL